MADHLVMVDQAVAVHQIIMLELDQEQQVKVIQEELEEILTQKLLEVAVELGHQEVQGQVLKEETEEMD